MPIRVQKFFVAVCPTCNKKINLGASDFGFSVHGSRDEIKELVNYSDYYSDYFPLDGAIAESCSKECGRKYYAVRAQRRKP